MRCSVSVILLFSSYTVFFSYFPPVFFESFSGSPCTKLHREKDVIEILLEHELIILVSSIFTDLLLIPDRIPLSAYYCHTNLLSNGDLIGTAGDSSALSQGK